MNSHYVINVARRNGNHYEHFFATSPHSCTRIEQARAVFREFCTAFPAPRYTVEVTRCTASNEDVTASLLPDLPHKRSRYARTDKQPHDIVKGHDSAALSVAERNAIARFLNSGKIEELR